MGAVVDPAPVAARRPEEGRAHPQLVVARAPILRRGERVVRRRAHVARVLVAARLGVRALVDEHAEAGLVELHRRRHEHLS